MPNNAFKDRNNIKCSNKAKMSENLTNTLFAYVYGSGEEWIEKLIEEITGNKFVELNNNNRSLKNNSMMAIRVNSICTTNTS